MKNNLAIVILLTVSLALRLIVSHNIPLFSDELDIGYQSFSLSQTGRDYSGNFLPTYIQSFAEFRAPLQMYITLPFVRIFGLSEMTTRLPVILLSIVSIYLVYKLFGLPASFILAFSPWHIHYSSLAFEVTTQLTLVLLGLCFFQKKPLFSAIFFGLTFYTYSTSILLIPLILFYLFFTLKTNRKIFLVAIFFVTFPILLNIISGTAGNRFSQISIFNDSKKEAEIVFKRTGFSSPNLKTDKFFYNKFTWTNSVLIKNYLDALSPNTIFAKGDSYPRHSVPGFGFFLITTLPIFLLGLIKNKNKLHLFMLLIVPIASALTQSGATHGTRLYLLVLPISLIIAAGFKHTSDNFKKIFVILFLINFIGFFYEYYFFYPKEQFNYFNTGYKQLLSNLPKSKIIISNSNYNAVIPYLFYNQYNPKQLIESGFSTRPNSNGQLVLDKNIIFQNSGQSFDQKLQNLASGDYLLLWQKEDIPGDWNFSSSPPAGFKSVKTTFLPNGHILGQLIQKNEK